MSDASMIVPNRQPDGPGQPVRVVRHGSAVQNAGSPGHCPSDDDLSTREPVALAPDDLTGERALKEPATGVLAGWPIRGAGDDFPVQVPT